MFGYRLGSTAISYPARFTFIFILIVLLFFAQICIPAELLIGTGNAETFSYFAGKTICRSIKRYEKNLGCKVVPTAADADKLTSLQNDSIDLALVNSKTIHDAFHGNGIFQFVTINYSDLRLLVPFYRSPVSLLVRRDAQIKEFKDLAGKRVNGGVMNTLENLIFRELLTLKGWTTKDFPVYQNLPHAFSQDFFALKNGSVQAMLHIGMHPDNSLKQLLSESQITLIGLDDPDTMQLVENKIGFSICRIAAGTYPGIIKEIKTLAMETLLIASAATDNETVQIVLSALKKSKQQLQSAHPSLLRQQIKVATLNDSYLHPHPSALLFFQTNRNQD